MRRFGLIGYPLSHSFSKKYFTEKFEKESISDAVYDNYPLERIDLLPELITGIQNLKGLNVTIPYKTSVKGYLSEIEKEAAATGAVNVICISENKKNLVGYNSDIFGFRESLVPLLGKSRYKALVLGTGGSSLAVKYVLARLGIDFVGVSRTSSEVSISYYDLTDDILRERNLIINTTPLGMFPDIGSSPAINYKVLGREHILFDLVYNPGITRFMALGKERGCTVKGGIEMLHLQAERSWRIWNEADI